MNDYDITNAQLEWLNPPPAWDVSGDQLTVTSAGQTDFWRKTHSGSIKHDGHFYGQTVGGDFTVSVCFSGEYAALYDQAGLMIRLDEEHWLKCGIELFNGVQQASVVVTNDFSDWSVLALPQSPPALHLRIMRKVTRHGATVEVFYAPAEWLDSPVDDAAFAMLRQCTMTDAPVQVGPMICAPTGDGFTARFAGFRVHVG